MPLYCPSSRSCVKFRFIDDIEGSVVGEKHCFEVKSQKKSFIIACPGVSEKLTWMDAIESAIRDHAQQCGSSPETPRTPGCVDTTPPSIVAVEQSGLLPQ